MIGILATSGPLTGKELIRTAGLDDFALWAACNRSMEISTKIIGARYLRLDRQVEGYARLSPSIMREFRSYTVIGAKAQADEILLKAKQLKLDIARISQDKFALAQKTIMDLVVAHPSAEAIQKEVCFIIAGDVVYGMAHAEPRIELSTGRIVRGSDLDLIVIVDNLPEPLIKSLDAAIYDVKYKLLINPAYLEEIDYIIKDLAKVREQLIGKDFKSLVAVKILNEAEFLYGNIDLFGKVKAMLAAGGIPDRMRAMEKKARAGRTSAENCLLSKIGDDLTEEEAMKLFYTAEEKEEIF